MKYLLFLYCLLFYFPVHGQNKNANFIGKYRDYFGSEIIINRDSTFKYTWHFNLFSSWSNGKWTIKSDTIYLKTIPIYDTLTYTNSNGKLVDSLVLSDDEHPKRIYPTIITNNGLLGGGQNHRPCPERLFYRDNKLYAFTDKGKLVRKKVRGFWSRKKFDPMYHKEF